MQSASIHFYTPLLVLCFFSPANKSSTLQWQNGHQIALNETYEDYRLLNVEQKFNQTKKLSDALTFAATFDQSNDANFAMGDSRIFTVQASGQEKTARPGLLNPDVKVAKHQGLHGHALAFTKKSKPAIFYPSKGNIHYDTEDWSGAISLWLSLDPEKDLEPGYVDPIQITDAGYNDAAIWVDFSDKNPRSFRMGIFGDLKVWNPDNIGPDENPAFQERLLTATNRPFGTGTWTHIVISFSNLNTEDGLATFYVNGKFQGTRGITEPFTWDLEKSKIFLGLNYVGLMDEVAIFNRALEGDEVNELYKLPGGIAELLKMKKS